MKPSHPPIEFLNTLSSICKEWKRCGGFFLDFNDCTIQYLIDNESFSEEISRKALNDLSKIILRLNDIIQHLYYHPDPIFGSLVALPGFSFGEVWFLRCDSSGFRTIYEPLMSARHKGPIEEYHRELGQLRHS